MLKLPAITRPKFDVKGSSAEVDKRVRSLVENGLSVYEVNAEALEKLKPDVILTQDQCEVCAVSLADVERAVCQFVHGQPRILSMRPHTLADIYSDIARIAEAIGRPEAGQEAHRLDAGPFRGHRRQGRRPAEEEARLHRVGRPADVGWPLDAGADRHCRRRQRVRRDRRALAWITWKEVAAANPDVVLVAPCGYDIEVTAREVRPLVRYADWQQLRAVRDHRVFLADGNAYFNRPGPRLVESAEILAEVLHPEVCDFGMRGKGYVAYKMTPSGVITKTAS